MVGNRRNIHPGALVLIAEDGIFRNKWPMGRVANVFLGHDDKV